jgi:LysR family transcriptional regulator, cyn operon transcriptional activator
LSQQIRQLEETLGVLLFDRSGRAIQLTDAGHAYGEYVRREHVANMTEQQGALL